MTALKGSPWHRKRHPWVYVGDQGQPCAGIDQTIVTYREKARKILRGSIEESFAEEIFEVLINNTKDDYHTTRT